MLLECHLVTQWVKRSEELHGVDAVRGMVAALVHVGVGASRGDDDGVAGTALGLQDRLVDLGALLKEL